MKMFQCIFLILVISFSSCYSEEIPTFLHICKRDEPNMLECFQTAAEKLKPYLATGVPEYNIPSLEPLMMNELISEESDGLRLTTTNVKTWGCSDFLITGGNIDVEKLTFDIDIDFPLLRIEAQYNMSGKLLMMPIKGEGPVLSNVTDCKSKSFLQGELYEKDGQTYMKFTKMTLKVNVGNGVVKIQNLFNGDKILNEVVNDAINKNLGLFTQEIMPYVEKALSAAILDIANKIVNPFTFEQLFPH